MRPLLFPFSAIVGQDPMKMALVLNAVDPSIGGVLIRGHKGTGKSTAARALARLLPGIETVENSPFNSAPGEQFAGKGVEVAGLESARKPRTVTRPTPFVELPLNATEDRLVGSLHVEKALRSGRRVFEPGLVAAANRGILYVDEVNLLDDHLVDLLLDTAASGVNIVEREGISISHPSRFILVGTMNPEEGNLRPQFLDRFGLCVDVLSADTLEARESVVARRLAFDHDPAGFIRSWSHTDSVISSQIVSARSRIAEVAIPGPVVQAAARLSQRIGAQGHRAEITVVKAARALAAFLEKPEVEIRDVAEVARLAVPHRMNAAALDSADDLRRRLERILRDLTGIGGETSDDEYDGSAMEVPELVESMQVPGSMAAGSIMFAFIATKEKESVHEPDPAVEAAELGLDKFMGEGTGTPRKRRAATPSRSGRYRKAVPVSPGERDFDVAIDASLRQSALRRAREKSPVGSGPVIGSEDLHRKQYVRPPENLIVFVVDSSDSMGEGAIARMRVAKGTVLSILRKAYQNRSEVALVAFGGDEARVLLPPTSSIEVARRALEKLPTGGATPFADGLSRAWQLIRSARLKNPGTRPVMVVISDGEANVPLSPEARPLEELGRLAARIGNDGITAVFIDAGTSGRHDMREIATRMRATWLPIRKLSTQGLLSALPAFE